MNKNKNSLFECEFPGCEFQTKSRSKIDFHHIIPKEVDPSPRNKATICLCKNHHSIIYHPKSKHGQHSIKTSESFEVINFFNSSEGKAIHYLNCSTNEKLFYLPKTRKIIPD